LALVSFQPMASVEKTLSGGLTVGALASGVDGEFARLLAQQADISQSMQRRHQAVVDALRSEIEFLRGELGDKDPKASLSAQSPLSPLSPASAVPAHGPTLRASGKEKEKVFERKRGSGDILPLTGGFSEENNLEEAEAMMQSLSSHDQRTQELTPVVPARQTTSELRPRVSQTGKRPKPVFADDPEVATPLGRQRNSRRSPSTDHIPGQVNLRTNRTASGEIASPTARRSFSTDAFGNNMGRRGAGHDPTGRSSIVSDRGPRQSTHAAAAMRAKTAEMRRVSSRNDTGGLGPGVGARAISAPVLDQVELALEPYETWLELFNEAIIEERRASMQSYSAQKSRMSVHNGKVTIESTTTFSKIMQALMMEPDGKRRLIWLLFSLLLIAYDMIMLPLSVYQLDISAFEGPMTVFSATFWTLDFILAFFVGYYVSGTLELRPQMTAKNYARTWMMPDLLLVLFEWVDAAIPDLPSLPSLVRSTRSFRILRFLKSTKLLRAAKLPGFFRYFPFISRSEYITLSLGIVRHLLGILFINHLIASFWYLLGQDPGGWLEVYEIPVGNWWYSYLITLHWSLTQFTPAAMDVGPQTLPERAFNVAVVIFALVTFSSFVSSITNLMTHLRNLESAEAILFSKLEDFMQSRKFSFYLTIRVRRYLDQRLAEKRSRPEEQDIELLQRLSEPLKMEVHFEMHSPTLTKHPLFFAYSRLNEPAMMKLCHAGLKTTQLSGDDYLFTKGETAKLMYFAMSGSLTYTKEEEPAPYPVQAPAYFSEMVLWCPWTHCGWMRAKTDCKLLCLDAAKFFDVVQHDKNCQLEVCAYAERAIHIQNKYFDKESRSDLNIGKFDPRRIVKKTFPAGSLDVRPAWFIGARSLNRHNSAGLMGGLRRQLSSQVSQPSEDEASSDSSSGRLSVRKKIVEQDNEKEMMLDSPTKVQEPEKDEEPKVPQESSPKRLDQLE